MNALSPLLELGLAASITETGSLRLKGLSTLPKDQVARIVEYAKNNKPEIMEELSSSMGLPEACPLVTAIVLDACRFHPRFFKRMMAEGILRRGDGCPLVSVCKLAGINPL